MKKKIKQIIAELKDLKEKAEYHSRMLVDNGREVPEIDRARAEGYASAYSFCIMRLENI